MSTPRLFLKNRGRREGKCKACMLVAAAAFILAMLVAAPVRAEASYHTQFLADKVVRLWFQRHDGVQVYAIIEKMNYTNRRVLWKSVREHSYVSDVQDGLYGPRQRMLYHGLEKTFADLLR